MVRRYDVVIASDVIYDMESTTALAAAVARRLALAPHALGLVAQGVRYHALQQLWLNLLANVYGIEARIQVRAAERALEEGGSSGLQRCKSCES
jgi:predicted nicotinamide N-methyase